MLELIKVKQLQGMADLAKQEQERANRWNKSYKDLELEHSTVLKESIGYWKRADKAESQISEMAQAIEEVAQKA